MVRLALILEPTSQSEPSMPFVSRELLRLSLDALGKDYSPLVIVSLPCMLRKRVPVCATAVEASQQAIKFGAADERAWLDSHFRVSGGPVGKPYFMPGTRQWVEEDYPGKTLQRRRKDYDGTIFHHPDASRWAFRQGASEQIAQKVLGQKRQAAVPLVALLAWMWRGRDVADLGQALSEFKAELAIDDAYFQDGVFSDEIPNEFTDAGLAAEPVDDATLAELVGAAAPVAEVGPPSIVAEKIKQALKDHHVLLPDGFVERVLGGWLVGDVVVFVGAPGTGKTFVAKAFGAGLEQVFGRDQFRQVFIEIAPDMDTSQFLGYESLSGDFTAGRFAREVLLTGEVNEARLVVLDEWNLAQIDNYFAPILSVLETYLPSRFPGRLAIAPDEREELLRAQPTIADGRWVLPQNTLFLATCNSWSDEPETRLPISGPVKRRCRIISMPNVLALSFEKEGVAGLVDACNDLLKQEMSAIEERRRLNQVSVWDGYRAARLKAIPNLDGLPTQARDKLLEILSVLLRDAATRASITIGVLKDVLLSCVFASDGQAFSALGEQVADKILHQVHGGPQVVQVLAELCRDFPNAQEIADLARRMGAGSGDRRIRPLV